MASESTRSMRRCAAVMTKQQLTESLTMGRDSMQWMHRRGLSPLKMVTTHTARWLAVLRRELQHRKVSAR